MSNLSPLFSRKKNTSLKWNVKIAFELHLPLKYVTNHEIKPSQKPLSTWNGANVMPLG